MCRSNCIQNPEWEEGYNEWTSYYLGDRVYAAPVVNPGTIRQVLLPPGKWYNALNGESIDSNGRDYMPQISSWRDWPLHYYRSGSLMIKQPYCLRAASLPETLKIEVYALGQPCRDVYMLYEDDGMSQSWENGEYGLIVFEMEERDEEILINIRPMEGEFSGRPVTRDYEITVFGKECNLGVINGQDFEPNSSGDQANCFRLHELSLSEEHSIRLAAEG
jgi:alpha-glucosidase (family GH31 glycosyl hydrolase)